MEQQPYFLDPKMAVAWWAYALALPCVPNIFLLRGSDLNFCLHHGGKLGLKLPT